MQHTFISTEQKNNFAHAAHSHGRYNWSSLLFISCSSSFPVVQVNVDVVVRLYPLFKFSFLLFLGMVMYDNNMIMSLKQKKRKFEPRIKLNHNIDIEITQLPTDCISSYLIFEGKNYSDYVAIISFHLL